MRFAALSTERLTIRPVVAADAEALHARRSEPAVAEFQSWTTPYDRGRADSLIGAVRRMDGPADDEWWMATVCRGGGDGDVIGDIAVRLSAGERIAEIGYTFASSSWGNGYATEAAAAMVEWLFDGVGVGRVAAMTHPDNHASCMVLERIGMLFEGHTRGSSWIGDVTSDDWIYGMVRSDWEAWRGRPRTPPDDVRLDEIDPESALVVYKVAPHRSQWRFVAPMEWSFADALFPEIVDGAPLVPWMRAVVADDDIVGFVMVALVTEHHPEPYLWRLLVDRMHQRRGLGRRILDLVSAQCLEWGHTTLTTSWGEGRGSPRPFYLAYGFELTGRVIDDETEARIQLD